ncbi:MAG: hypothetical protein KKG00_14250 [Bacteroidetes bacterium]|nr:hypothetical protein [Bacteroidota bacterium]
MPGKLNQMVLKEYAARFTAKVLFDFYHTKEVINGQELLSLTPSKQINLGIISRLFDQWKSDAQAFRSPYFNFESKEVQDALQEFMNTVSRHISIGRDDLQPMLLEATTDALLLLLAPADYFERKLKAMPNFTYDVENAKRLTKYTHIHQGIARALALRLTDSGEKFVYVNKALGWLAEMMAAGASLDDVVPYVEEFSTVLPLHVNSIVPQSSSVSETVIAPPAGKSFFDTALSDTPASGYQAPPVASAPVASKPAPQPVQPVASTSLNSHYKVDVPPSHEDATYGSVQVKVDSILKSIALGHRFMFVNQLFDRDSDAFDKSMRELDQAGTFEEARSLMAGKFASLYGWDMNSEAVADLLALVKRRYN